MAKIRLQDVPMVLWPVDDRDRGEGSGGGRTKLAERAATALPHAFGWGEGSENIREESRLPAWVTVALTRAAKHREYS